MTEVAQYTPDDFIAGDEPVKTGRAYVVPGQSFARLTPLMLQQDAGGGEDTTLLTTWDGTPGTAVALSAKAHTSPVENELIPYYKTGCFRINFVQWPDGLTDSQKRAAFIGSPISVDDEL